MPSDTIPTCETCGHPISCDWCGKPVTDPHLLPTGDAICPECDETHDVVETPTGVTVEQTAEHSILGAPTARDTERFYIVREGTNIRATTRDREPTIVQGRDRALDIAQGYEDVVRPRVGSLVPIRVDEYHERYEEPRIQARSGTSSVPKGKAMEGDSGA